jgi:hypothetical protein
MQRGYGDIDSVVTEIDAATLAGQEAGGLVAEFERLSRRMLERSQSAEA